MNTSRGVAIFAKACFGRPSPSKQQKLNATYQCLRRPSPRVPLLPNLVSGNGIEKEGSSWAFYHNTHPYLQWYDGQGWGVFTRFGIAERNTNPVDWSAVVGISGKGIFDARPNDSFGIGYYSLEINDTPIFNFLDLNDENGAELWYNAEITP